MDGWAKLLLWRGLYFEVAFQDFEKDALYIRRRRRKRCAYVRACVLGLSVTAGYTSLFSAFAQETPRASSAQLVLPFAKVAH
jgi:hypothetical protein